MYYSKLAIFVFFIFFSACQNDAKKDETLVEVKVNAAVEKKILSWDVFQGRFQSPQISRVLPRVAGLIVKAPFLEGSTVEKDSILFEIDDRPFVADSSSKEAYFQKSQAVFNQKQTRYNRYKKLKEANAISVDEFETVEAEYKEAKADLEIAKSDREISKLNLEWTKVRAPIAGKVGKKLVTIGNLVSSVASASTILTTITSMDPMFISIDVPERKFHGLRDNDKIKIPCEARLENQKDFSRKGIVNFVDNHINEETGTIEIRCTFPNPNRDLIEGLYSEVRILVDKPFKTVLIEDSSILTDQASRYVLYVDEKNIIQRADIELGELFQNIRSVPKGIKPDTKIIAEDLQKLRVGQEVKISEIVPINLSKSSDFIVE